MAVSRTNHAEGDFVAQEIEVIDPTDLKPLWRGLKHCLIIGITGSGKTSLLFYLIEKFIENGYTILHRDDGKLQFRYLMPYYPTTIFIPEGCSLNLEYPNELKLDYEIRSYNYRDPKDLIQQVLKGKTKTLTVVVFDKYCKSAELQAKFYQKLFDALIFECMRSSKRKVKLLFSIDELNDIVQPRGESRTEEHKKVSYQVAYDIRKLRKHKVTFLATCHRPNDIPLNVRSQFDYFMLKKTFGTDVYQFIRFMVPKKYVETLTYTVRTMPTDQVLLIDYAGNFAMFHYPNMLRGEGSKIHYQAEGIIKSLAEESKGKKYDAIDLIIVLERSKIPPTPFYKIAEKFGLSKTAIIERFQKLLRIAPDDVVLALQEARRYQKTWKKKAITQKEENNIMFAEPKASILTVSPTKPKGEKTN